MLAAYSIFIIPTSRGTYPVLDLLRAIRWSCEKSFYVIIADRTGEVKLPEHETDCTVLAVNDTEKLKDGFVAGLALKWAIDQGANTHQFVLLSDECMVIQRGLDTWSLAQLTKTRVGLLGVLDRDNYNNAYGRCAPIMDHWGMPHMNYEPDGHTLADPIFFLAADTGKLLYEHNLLFPEECRQWPLPYGTFISWAAQMHSLYQVGWGHLDKQMPPLYANKPGRASMQPAPHILSSRFMLYCSARRVPGYSEENLREAFKRMRGEEAVINEPMHPLVSPQPRGPSAIG